MTQDDRQWISEMAQRLDSLEFEETQEYRRRTLRYMGTEDLGDVRILMKTFRDWFLKTGGYWDPGTCNEHVSAVIESAPPRIWCAVLLEELARMKRDAAFVLADLLWRACHFHSDAILTSLQSLSLDQRRALSQAILSWDEAIEHLERDDGGRQFLAAVRDESDTPNLYGLP